METLTTSTPPVTGFLTKLKEITNNHAFLTLITTDFPFLMLLNRFMREQPEASVDEIRVKIREYADIHAKEGPREYLALVEALYIVYIRENVTGPSVY